MMTLSCRGRIGAAVRDMLRDPDWPWRHTKYKDATKELAASILRNKARRARAWLLRTHTRGVLSLPVGNGLDGPWNRIAFVTQAGRLGVVDIAVGCAVEYDCQVPRYVKLFAMPVTRAGSPNQAGGTGGLPASWSQIALMLSDDTSVKVSLPSAITPIEITWV